MRWVIGVGLGLPLLVIVLLVIFMAALGVFLGGGMPGTTGAHTPPIGTAEARPALWLGVPAVAGSSLPNVLILSVMAHESGGEVLAQNYNCLGGTTSAQPCEQSGGMTLSEDAGLMQLNSGGWPAPRDATKWRTLGMADDPFDPSRNLPAGVDQLQAELREYKYLKFALEAYNAGSGGPMSTDTTYAIAVRSYVSAYEAGPTLAVWSTADYSSGQWEAHDHQAVWLVVAAVGPYGAKFSVPWKPGKTVCTTTADPKPGKPATTCVRQHDPLTGRNLTLPSIVTANGRVMVLSPQGGASSGDSAPLWPGEEGFALQVRGPGTYRITARWPGGHSATASITIEPEKGGG